MDTNLKKTWKGIFDDVTIMTLYRLLKKGNIKELKTIIKQGKESQIIAADDSLAVKVYAVHASNFKQMHQYLIGDERFQGIKKDKSSTIFAWCRKEFSNLKIAQRNGVSCPEPIAFMKNVLVMSFLGKDYKPYPKLKETKLEDPEGVFNDIIENLRKLYKAGLVHGDLSEYNILVADKVYFIDFSQAVLLKHPNAEEFLKHDIHNVCKFFSKYFTMNEEKILEIIKLN